MEKIPFPKSVDLALTGKCNLKCKHCNTADTWNIENELSFKEITAVFDQLRELKVFEVNLFGGEPFCHPKIYDLIERLNAYPLRITILTNGTLIDKTAITYLKRMRFLANIQISIDGSTSQTHDWQRGKGSFEKAINAVRLLIENNLPVSIKAIINLHNYTDIEPMAELALGLGLGGMDFGDAVACGRAAVYSSQMRFEEKLHNQILREFLRIKEIYPIFRIGGTMGQKIDMLFDFYLNGPGKGKRGAFSTCPAGHNMLSIRSDGKVVPCSAFWTLICGDIRKNTLMEIWDNSKTLNEIRALAKEPLGKYCNLCKDCDYLSYCNGGCRADAYYSSGMNLKGISKSNCAVFSNISGFRLNKNEVLEFSRKKEKECLIAEEKNF